DVILQVADGLDYVHRSGLLQLDVKPSNVLISEAGSARLIDFDGAQPIGHADRMSMIITRELAAPETRTVAEGGERPSPSLTPTADIYSLAASAALLLGCLEEGGSLPASSPLLSARRWKQVRRVLE